MIYLFKLYLLDSFLACCMFLKMYPFSLDHPIFWHIIIHSVLLWFFLYLCDINCDFFPFVSDFIWVLYLFFLVSIAKVNCFIYKKAAILFHWSFLLFLVSVLFIYSLISSIFFLLLTLCSVLPFLNTLGGC